MKLGDLFRNLSPACEDAGELVRICLDAWASWLLPLTRWEPALVFEVKQQLTRAFKAMSNRKDADKLELARRISELQAELTVLDPARVLTLP